MSRPKHNPKPDANHSIVSDFVRQFRQYGGLPLDCLDLSKRGGRMVDWVLSLGPLAIWVEVKTPEAFAGKDCGMTDGEREFFDTWPGPKAIACDAADLAEICRNWYPVALSAQRAIEGKANEQITHNDYSGRGVFTADGWQPD